MSLTAKDWSVSALSVELRRDKRTIAKIISDSGIKPSVIKDDKRKTKLYRMAAIVAAMLDSEELDLQQERARLAKEQREKVRIDNMITQKKYVPVDAVRGSWVKISSVIKTRMLAFPSKVSARVHVAQTIGEIDHILQGEVREILGELHDDVLSTVDK